MPNIERKVLSILENFQNIVETESKKLEDTVDKIVELFVDSVTDSLDKLSDYQALNSQFICGSNPNLKIAVTDYAKLLTIENSIDKNKDELIALFNGPISSFRESRNQIQKKLDKIAEENNLQSLIFKRSSLEELGYKVTIRLTNDQYFKYKKLLEEI